MEILFLMVPESPIPYTPPPEIRLWEPILVPLICGLVFWLQLALHELAHAGAGLLVGYQIHAIRIGTGGEFLRLHLGRTLLCLGVVPLGGMVTSCVARNDNRLKTVLFAAAGPVMDSVVLVLLCRVVLFWSAPSYTSLAAGYLLFFLLYSLLHSLVPQEVWLVGRLHSNDARLIREAMRRKAGGTGFWEKYALWLTSYWDGVGQRPQPSRISERIATHLFSTIDSFTHVPDASGRAALERELAGPLHPAEASLILDSLIWRAVFAERQDLLGQMDSWSVKALALWCDLDTLRVARGAVLGALGRHREALAILTAPPGLRVDGLRRLMRGVFAAQSFFRSGEGAEALRCYEAAVTACGPQLLRFHPSVRDRVARIGLDIGAPVDMLSGDDPVTAPEKVAGLVEESVVPIPSWLKAG
ncbi:MAG: site-2 protease family protein [Alphaproteobacteria bacterium]|nr:site-2 protease family protein [Alphaproteobacteria bacterium]